MDSYINSVAITQYNALDLRKPSDSHKDFFSNKKDNSDNIDILDDFGTKNTLPKILVKQKSFVEISHCVIEHIISTNNLSSSEKLYYLVNDLYSMFLKNWSNKEINFSAKKIADLLGFSKSQIFTIQKKLELLGYLKIIRSTDKYGKNNVNIPITTLPEECFWTLMRNGQNKSSVTDFSTNKIIIDVEERREVITKYKQFIPINLNIAKSVFFNKNLSVNSKLIFINLFSVIHKIKHHYNYPIYAGSIELKSFTKSCNVSRSTIYRAFNQLEQENLIRKQKLSVKGNEDTSNKFDKIIHYIEILIPDCTKKPSLDQKYNNVSTVKLSNEDKNYCSQIDPQCVTNRPPIYTYKNKNNKNTEKIDKKDNFLITETLHNNLFLKSNFLKKGFKRKNRKSSTVKKTAINNNTLYNFYPLSKEDAEIIQKKSGREFSLKVMNEILLNISQKLTTRVFRSKTIFLNYMVKIFKYEKRQANLVNNENFKIKANYQGKYLKLQISDKEMESLFCKIENEAITSRSDYNQLRAKLINTLPSSLAYDLAKNMYDIDIIPIDDDISKAEISLRRPLKNEISDIQLDNLISQIKAVYGSNVELLRFVEKIRS